MNTKINSFNVSYEMQRLFSNHKYYNAHAPLLTYLKRRLVCNCNDIIFLFCFLMDYMNELNMEGQIK